MFCYNKINNLNGNINVSYYIDTKLYLVLIANRPSLHSESFFVYTLI